MVCCKMSASLTPVGDISGTTSSAACTNCVAGSYATGLGLYFASVQFRKSVHGIKLPNLQSCQVCVLFLLNMEFAGLISSQACTLCPRGTYSPTAGSILARCTCFGLTNRCVYSPSQGLTKQYLPTP